VSPHPGSGRCENGDLCARRRLRDGHRDHPIRRQERRRNEDALMTGFQSERRVVVYNNLGPRQCARPASGKSRWPRRMRHRPRQSRLPDVHAQTASPTLQMRTTQTFSVLPRVGTRSAVEPRGNAEIPYAIRSAQEASRGGGLVEFKNGPAIGICSLVGRTWSVRPGAAERTSNYEGKTLGQIAKLRARASRLALGPRDRGEPRPSGCTAENNVHEEAVAKILNYPNAS